MRRSLLISVTLAVALSGSVRGDNDLPKRSPGEVLEAEPTLMLNDLPGAPMPPSESPSSGEEVRRLESELARAERRAAAGERLFKSGILAKVEAEKRTLQVVRVRRDLQAARARAAEEQLTAVLDEFAAQKVGAAEVAASEALRKEASEKATQAQENLQRAELHAAELNLSRQRKLLAAGIGRKALVKRAEEKVEAMKSTMVR